MAKINNNKNAYYERLVPDRLPWYHKQMYHDHLDRYKFAGQFVPNKNVLDIACGSGYGSLYLVEKGALSVVGVDISKESIGYAKKDILIKKLDM